MAPDADPYRTLGLERGATLDDVKKAYRRLAKANHPDAAGEAALPRFLAIQAAYDQIAGPDGGNRGSNGRGPGGAARRAWDADPDRAGATRRAYGGRPRSRPGPTPGPRPRPGPRPERPEGSDQAPGPGRPNRPNRPPKKATLGSTSYDGVDTEAFDPDWGGASWYGTTSGTYWTLNPKEYADPRKHGPEYQARARRAGVRPPDAERPESPLEAASETPDAPGTIGVDAAAAAEAATTPPIPPTPPTHTTSSWWEATTGETAATSRSGTGAPPARPAPPAQQPPLPTAARGDDLSVDAAVDSVRTWLDDVHPSIAARLGRAFIAWTPIALGIGWGAGEISGCGRFAATCDPAAAPVSWALQLAALALLILVPRLARVATYATFGVLAMVFPTAVLLFASDPAGTETARAILGALMVIGWVAGLAYGAAREFRRRARPVS
ncbi:MAG TPA: J domain-containing protein [Candidatus Limnocylindrales bacterium]|nr:J domain-containing protein [Candidatus Limnocylindrales bacterium]